MDKASEIMSYFIRHYGDNTKLLDKKRAALYHLYFSTKYPSDISPMTQNDAKVLLDELYQLVRAICAT